MPTKTMSRSITLMIVYVALTGTTVGAEPLSVDQVVAMAVSLSPQVRAARARWDSATHSIEQNYAPADPQVGIASLDSPTNGFTAASANTYEVSESFQFPGKALVQGSIAKRNAEIERLKYEAAVRDVRITAVTDCYQLALDQGLKSRMVQTISDLRQLAAAADPTQNKADVEAVAGEVAEERQNQKRLNLAIADDAILLNALLRRRGDEPVEVNVSLEVEPVTEKVDDLIDRAWSRRQEILQLALASQNTESALTLARLQYAPDYSVGYVFNHYRLASDAPAPNLTQTHSVFVSFNLPIFFWMKQNEEVRRSRYDLEAAREDLDGLRIDTAAKIESLYRHAEFDQQEAVLYHDTIIPTAEEVFASSLASYRRNREYFAELSQARERLRDARSTYLAAVGRLLADRVELEQLIGEPLQHASVP